MTPTNVLLVVLLVLYGICLFLDALEFFFSVSQSRNMKVVGSSYRFTICSLCLLLCSMRITQLGIQLGETNPEVYLRAYFFFRNISNLTFFVLLFFMMFLLTSAIELQHHKAVKRTRYVAYGLFGAAVLVALICLIGFEVMITPIFAAGLPANETQSLSTAEIATLYTTQSIPVEQIFISSFDFQCLMSMFLAVVYLVLGIILYRTLAAGASYSSSKKGLAYKILLVSFGVSLCCGAKILYTAVARPTGQELEYFIMDLLVSELFPLSMFVGVLASARIKLLTTSEASRNSFSSPNSHAHEKAKGVNSNSSIGAKGDLEAHEFHISTSGP